MIYLKEKYANSKAETINKETKENLLELLLKLKNEVKPNDLGILFGIFLFRILVVEILENKLKMPELNLNEDDLSDNLSCSLCYDIFVDPVTSGCGKLYKQKISLNSHNFLGHTFCRNCLSR